jgi:hypothetical protein
MGQGREWPVWGDRHLTVAPQDELNYLRDYTQGLEEALNATRMRMAEIEKAQKGE